MLAVLTWMAIPTALALGRCTPDQDPSSKVAPRRTKLTAGLVIASLTTFVVFFHVLLFPIAERSLARGRGHSAAGTRSPSS